MRKQLPATCRFNVAKFADNETDSEGRTTKDWYLQGVLEQASESWTAEGQIEKQWQSVRTAIVSTSAEVLETSRHCQPDWFAESFGGLRPLLTARNNAYSHWLN